jgi:hypothetical protein
MSFYPATIVAVSAESATARIDATGKLIVFSHQSAYAVPAELRQVGTKGYISFPKAPPVFSAGMIDSHAQPVRAEAAPKAA